MGQYITASSSHHLNLPRAWWSSHSSGGGRSVDTCLLFLNSSLPWLSWCVSTQEGQFGFPFPSDILTVAYSEVYLYIVSLCLWFVYYSFLLFFLSDCFYSFFPFGFWNFALCFFSNMLQILSLQAVTVAISRDFHSSKWLVWRKTVTIHPRSAFLMEGCCIVSVIGKLRNNIWCVITCMQSKPEKLSVVLSKYSQSILFSMSRSDFIVIALYCVPSRVFTFHFCWFW